MLGADGAVPERQFTPRNINMGKCMARTWGGGLGGQCNNNPVAGSDLCKVHGKSHGLAHGRVDGDIPPDKFTKFLNEGARSRKK